MESNVCLFWLNPDGRRQAQSVREKSVCRVMQNANEVIK
jgi:hypothetical protein